MPHDTAVMDILRKGGYTVTAKRLGDGLLLTVPPIKFEPHQDPAVEVLISVVAEGVVVTVDGENEAWEIPVPRYARRLVAALEADDVYRSVSVDASLIDWRREDGSVAAGLGEIWPIADEDGPRERVLVELIDALRRGDDVRVLEEAADAKGVREGFDVCKAYSKKGD